MKPESGFQAFHSGIEARLVTCGLVFLDDAMADCPINNRNRALVGSVSCFVVSRLDCSDRFLERCTERRALAGVVLTP